MGQDLQVPDKHPKDTMDVNVSRIIIIIMITMASLTRHCLAPQQQPGEQKLKTTTSDSRMSSSSGMPPLHPFSTTIDRRATFVRFRKRKDLLVPDTTKSTATSRKNQRLYYDYHSHHQKQWIQIYAAVYGTNWKLARNLKKKKRAQEPSSKQKKPKPKQTSHETEKRCR